mmetsp:Transcript_27622/g.42287  ORF Transcript_27622/g.42287 Transcript_27622/m.42287 type:complete len:732 (+) Transcript_27622:302-2497(+)
MHPNLNPMDNHVANYTETLEVGKPHAVTADDYSWDPTTSETRTKLKLEQLSLQDAGSTVSVLVPPITGISSNEGLNDSQTDASTSTNDLRQQNSTISDHRDSSHRRKKKEKKIEQDAAKTAAVYYGECYMEGVGIKAADRAAKDSHHRYKKWWLQEMHSDGNLITSLGDSLNVPRYAPPPKTSLHAASGRRPPRDEMDVDDSKTNTFGGRAHAVAAATLENDMNSTSIGTTYAARPVYLDRASGTHNPSPIESNQTIVSQVGPIDGSMKEPKRNKKRPRTVPTAYIQPQFLSNNYLTTASDQARKSDVQKRNNFKVTSPFKTDEKPAAIVSEPEGNESESIISGVAFESEKRKRREVQHRGSSYSDYVGDQIKHPSPIYTEARRERRPSDFYHEEANRYRSSSIQSDKKQSLDKSYFGEKHNAIMTSIESPLERTAKQIDNAKLEVIRSLAVSGGDVTNKTFLFALEQLRALYLMTDLAALNINDASKSKSQDGNWLLLSRPNYAECLGTNSAGEYMYTLGRMSFDMFTPSSLVCSISGVFNSIEIVKDKTSLRSIPKKLKDDIGKADCALRRYNLITAFKVESSSPLFGPNSPNQNVNHPLRGTITTHGYMIPDPHTPNRHSIWFSSGKIEPNVEDKNLDLWKRAFSGGTLRRHLSEKARVLAAKLLLGALVPSKMEDDGSMEFEMTRPIGGHGSAYVDVLYMDENLRIVQGHRGSLFVSTRVSSSIQEM